MADFVNACQTCGAEESLDSLLHRMIDDDTVRRLIADVLTMSLPLGGLVVRYLRLHKPAKQRLRMEKVAVLLTELVPDMQRSAIERSGRNWMVSAEDWKGAFAAVFAAVDKGSLEVPLKNGNAYLYSVLLRKSDRAEAEQEAQRELDRRTGPRAATVNGPASVADLVQPPTPSAAPRPAPAAPAPAGMSPTVRAMRAFIDNSKRGATP